MKCSIHIQTMCSRWNNSILKFWCNATQKTWTVKIKNKSKLNAVGKSLVPKTNLLSATLVVSLFLFQLIKVKCFWQSTEVIVLVSTLRAPVPTNLWFSIVFSHWNAYYPDPNKTVDAFLFFSNIFWIICFWLFSFKTWLQNLSRCCYKNWITHY